MSKPTMFSKRRMQAVTFDDLSPHDRKAYRLFERFLKLKAAGYWDKMIKRPFWRKYLGLDQDT